MPPSRRSIQATAALTETPPNTLPPRCTIARVVKGVGNNIYSVRFPASLLDKYQTSKIKTNDHDCGEKERKEPGADNTVILAELSSRFRNKIWLKNGGFVVVDLGTFDGRGNKLSGEIVNVIRQERVWMQMSYWPKEFTKRTAQEDSDDEDSNVGKLPPSPEPLVDDCGN